MNKTGLALAALPFILLVLLFVELVQRAAGRKKVSYRNLVLYWIIFLGSMGLSLWLLNSLVRLTELDFDNFLIAELFAVVLALALTKGITFVFNIEPLYRNSKR